MSVGGILSRYSDAPALQGIYCHYVFDDQVERFRRILEQLLTVGEFVDSDTCLSMLRGEREIDARYFHLSFDDGFRNVFTNAAPILRDLDVPAIAFVPSSLVEAPDHEVSEYCLEVTGYRSAIEILSWDEVRSLPDFGVEIGSHTRTHARLSEISGNRDRLWDEVSGSKDEIEKNTGRPCKYISWPYGEAGDVDDRAIELIRAAGYDACFSAVRGSIEPGVSNEMKVPRHHFEVQWPWSHIKFFLSRA